MLSAGSMHAKHKHASVTVCAQSSQSSVKKSEEMGDKGIWFSFFYCFMTVHRQPRVVVGPGWKFANWLHSSPSRNDKYCCHIDQMTKQDCLTQQEATWPHKSTASELYIALNQRYESCLF